MIPRFRAVEKNYIVVAKHLSFHSTTFASRHQVYPIFHLPVSQRNSLGWDIRSFSSTSWSRRMLLFPRHRDNESLHNHPILWLWSHCMIHLWFQDLFSHWMSPSPSPSSQLTIWVCLADLHVLLACLLYIWIALQPSQRGRLWIVSYAGHMNRCCFLCFVCSQDMLVAAFQWYWTG